MADIAVINKVDSAPKDKIEIVRRNIQTHNPDADIILAESSVLVDRPERVRNQRVLVVKDGPTLTHGEMSSGAGLIAAELFGASEIVDPRSAAVGSLSDTYRRYPHIGSVLPAMGYTENQIRDLKDTVDRIDCDLVLFATPIHLPRLLSIEKPTLRVRYEYQDHGSPTLDRVLMSQLFRKEQ